MKQNSLLFLLSMICATVCVCAPLWSQSVHGYVKDAASKEALIGVNILQTGTSSGTATNEFGYYSFATKNDQLTLRFSYIGYRPVDTVLTITDNLKLDIFLYADQALPEIEIVASPKHFSNQLGRVNLPMEQLDKVPALLGEADPFKALALTPGISQGAEGTSGLYIRGGTPDQNLVLFDGSRVYNTTHLFGYLSPFNPDAIKHIQLYKGGFPGRFGGRLSSVIEVTGKDGNKSKSEHQLSVGLVNARATSEGPIVKDRVSYLVGARTTYLAPLTWLSKLQFKGGSRNDYQTYFFYDFNAKVNYHDGQNNLSVSYYDGLDQWGIAERSEDDINVNRIKWGNQLAAVRYARGIGSKFFGECLFNWNYYRYGINQSIREEATDSELATIGNQSFVREWNASLHGIYYLHPKWEINLGLELGNILATPRNISFDEQLGLPSALLVQSKDSIDQYAAYLDNIFTLTDWLQLRTTIRHNVYRIKAYNRQFTFTEPRFSLRINPAPRWTIQLNYDQMHQPLHLLNSNSIGVPSDIWVVATGSTPPQTSRQYSAGLEYDISGKWTASMEMFYKRSEGLIDYRQGSDFFQSNVVSWEEIIARDGRGRSYGLELFLNKKFGRLTGWLSYTLSWNRVKFPDINDGNWYFRRYDRRHDVSLTGNYKLSRKWSVQGNFVLQSGYRTTLPVAVFYDPWQNAPLPYYQGRNNARAPAYHRLDLAMQKDITRGKKLKAQLSFGVYNIYARTNPFYVMHDFRSTLEFAVRPRPITFQGTVRVKSFLNFIPFINYKIYL